MNNLNKNSTLNIDVLRVKGARENNLNNISVEIPRGQLTVITGVSGSGKSSLAFDTIYAEGQRRYVESLSAYARQFLEMMQKPDVDLIEGLSPAISIEQKTTHKNPRSTVGTVTEIYDYMRLLWSRIGIPYSPATGLPIKSQSVSQIVDSILEFSLGSRIYLLAPIIRGRKGEYKKEIIELSKKGYQRIQIDGEIYNIEDTPDLDKKKKHNLEAVVDRLVIDQESKYNTQRIADSVETCLNLADGIMFVEDADTKKKKVYSANFSCPVSGFTIEEIEPRLFSFNNPYGACPKCDGIGIETRFDSKLVIPNNSLTLRSGAVAPWASSTSKYYMQTLNSIARFFKISLDSAFKDLPTNVTNTILFGSKNTLIKMNYDDGLKSYQINRPFEGVIPNLERRFKETESSWIREDLNKYQLETPCNECYGKRLNKEALAVKIKGMEISSITGLSITEASSWFNELNSILNPTEKEISSRILKEITERLGFLVNVGLNYLSLGRNSGTLSGGESQRIRLASQIGSGLTGVLYVLDEPSIGLHQRDNNRLLKTLSGLKNLGNTVIVVEHDEEAIRAADYIIDIGPGAGVKGGDVTASGSVDDLISSNKSITGKYLSGEFKILIPSKRRLPVKDRFLLVKEAKGNNLKSINVAFPLGILTCVTGVSGGGKSTLVLETLWKALSRKLNDSKTIPLEHESIEGYQLIDKIIDINQSPIGRTPRSNPATYTGAFTPIREWFSLLPEAKARGYSPGRFSFNVKGGRCEGCKGDGLIKIEMHFLADVDVQCDQCKGKRYNRETLEVLWRDKSISDVLDMTVSEGLIFFKAVPSIKDKLETMNKVGLGYIKIGQQATTLSGGEAQRIKLSKELSKRATGKTIYILDEPTTGLHFEDIRKLLEVLDQLVKNGNTVIIIEHNLDVIKTADWIIDMGPEGGDKGGYVVAEGPPEIIASIKKSYTGNFLSKILDKKKSIK